MFKKNLLCLIVLALVMFISSSVFAYTFYYTFQSRGTAVSQSNKHTIYGSTCELAANFLKVDIDPHTSEHHFVYKVQYWTTSFLGIYGLADEKTLVDVSIGNYSSSLLSVYYNFGTTNLVDNTYSSNDKAYIKGFASSATNAFYFTISNAVFTFEN